MRNRFAQLLPAALLIAAGGLYAQPQFRRLPVKEYRDKMIAGWVGQMVGVTWGLPVEFRFNDEKVPQSMVPHWDPVQINDALTNDDVFNDSRLLYLVDKFGLAITSRQAEMERWRVWGPNGRLPLLSGIAPPDLYRRNPQVPVRQNLGFQISADVLGLLAPGLPNTTISLAERLNDPYGDVLYSGQFMAAMYGEAFFERSPERVIAAGLRAIPEGSTYAEMVRQVVGWHAEYPHDWDKAWQLVHDRYPAPEAPGRGRGAQEQLNMDVLRNGGYVLLGLLYGDGDLDRTIVDAMRGGDDADCNPANAAGVLFTTIGYSKLPERFRYPIDGDVLMTYDYARQRGVLTYPQILEKTEALARAAVVQAGGRIEKDAAGEEVFVIPVIAPKPSQLYRAGDAIPQTGSKFTAEEMAAIRGTAGAPAEFQKRAPGWTASANCQMGFLPYVNYRENVFLSYAADDRTPCTLTRDFAVPADGSSTLLDLLVSHPADGAFVLVAKVDGQEVLHLNINQGAAAAVATQYDPPWMHGVADLTPWAGKTVKLEVAGQPGRWNNPTVYWGRVAIDSSSAVGEKRGLGLWDNSGDSFKRIHEQTARPRNRNQ
ncbi:MAG: ADP-ribosylglycohydrolase family protein [Ignavibacteriota bacterium]